MRLLTILLPAIVASLALATGDVTVHVEVPQWPHVPVVVEALESLAMLHPRSFWIALHAVPRWGAVPDAQVIDQLLVAHVGSALSPQERRIMRMSMDLHARLPQAVAMLRLATATHANLVRAADIPANCTTFMVTRGGKCACGADQIATLADQIVASSSSSSESAADSDVDLLEIDHRFVWHTNPQPGAPVVVLYSDVRQYATVTAHESLMAHAKAGHIHYVFRHFLPSHTPSDTNSSPPPPLRLSGYGIELSIKDVEYKAVDDSADGDITPTPDSPSSSPSALDTTPPNEWKANENIQGIYFARLYQRHPHLADKLVTLRAHLLQKYGLGSSTSTPASSSSSAHALPPQEELKPFKMHQLFDMGLQTVARVVANNKSDPLGVLADIAQNFPARARSLLSTRVSRELRREVDANAKILSQYAPSSSMVMPQSASGAAGQPTLLLVNGRPVAVDTLDPFAMLDILTEEERLFGSLNLLSLNDSTVRRALTLPVSTIAAERARIQAAEQGASGAASTTTLAVDYRAAPVHYANNLDSDAMYQKWPRQLSALLQPQRPGTMRFVARNVISVLLALDLSRPDDRRAFVLAFSMIDRGLPAHVGFLLLARNNTASTASTNGGDSVYVTLFQAYASVRDSYDSQHALRWLHELLERLLKPSDLPPAMSRGKKPVAHITSGTLTLEHIEDAYASAGFDRTQFRNMIGPDCEYEHTRLAMLDAASNLGIDDPSAPVILVNGVELQLASSHAPNGVQSLEYALVDEYHRQMPMIQQALYYGTLVDSGSSLNLLHWWFAKHGAVSRRNPYLIPSASNPAVRVPLPLRIPNLPLSREDDARATWDYITKPTDVATEVIVSLPYYASPIPRASTKAKQPKNNAASNSDSSSSSSSSKNKKKKSKKNKKARVLPTVANVTHWIVADVCSGEAHLSLVDTVLKRLQASDVDDTAALGVRVGLIHSGEYPPCPLAAALVSLPELSPQTPRDSLIACARVLTGTPELVLLSDVTEQRQAIERAMHSGGASDGPCAGVSTADAQSLANHLVAGHNKFRRVVLQLNDETTRAIVTNGRVVAFNGSIVAQGRDRLAVADVTLLEFLEVPHRTGVVAPFVEELVFDEEHRRTPRHRSDVALSLASLLVNAPGERERRSLPAGLLLNETRVHLPGGFAHVPIAGADFAGGPSLLVDVVLDPLSKDAQRLAPMLRVLQRAANAEINLVLAPRSKIATMPLDRFYHYVWHDSSRATSSVSDAPQLKGLPGKVLLTLSLDTPQAWFMQSLSSPHDLDNLRLSGPATHVEATFELVDFLVEGQAVELPSGMAAVGLQVQVEQASTDMRPRDTLVMQNAAYFQLRASPGLWSLTLRPGRSTALYDMVMPTMTSTAAASESVAVVKSLPVLVSSFRGATTAVYVRKKAGMEKVNLLDVADKQESDAAPEPTGADADAPKDSGTGSIWSGIASKLLGATENTADSTTAAAAVEDDNENTVNVFSVASGHLYERFLRIMMLSVVRNTKRRVKFWILENYLSPLQRSAIPVLARAFGFRFEFITYKWPWWLRGQTQKQRVIWGYKILFLDVLFPLHLKRVVFIDSDQIVRADLGELMDMNLRGAPYAFVPFCDSRPEMHGFAFWRSGYWKSHLQGRPYHISALYVVDLQRFRMVAAGDRLRAQYQQLSADPNSLSNLDQDLPNNMIHQIPIYSLPQEWLYCETWCSTESKGQAKTIDLCNNPKTKEPKLDAAARIVPEWTAYDDEIRAVLERARDNERRDEL